MGSSSGGNSGTPSSGDTSNQVELIQRINAMLEQQSNNSLELSGLSGPDLTPKRNSYSGIIFLFLYQVLILTIHIFYYFRQLTFDVGPVR